MCFHIPVGVSQCITTGPESTMAWHRFVHWYACITQLKYKNTQKNQMKMRQWQPTRHGSPKQIHQATLSIPRRVFTSENRKCDSATAASYCAIRAATMATSSDTNGVVQVTENAPHLMDIRNVHLIVIDCGDKYSSWQWSTQLDSCWGNVIWCRARILEYCELEFFPTGGTGLIIRYGKIFLICCYNIRLVCAQF